MGATVLKIQLVRVVVFFTIWALYSVCLLCVLGCLLPVCVCCVCMYSNREVNAFEKMQHFTHTVCVQGHGATTHTVIAWRAPVFVNLYVFYTDARLNRIN